jgi:hypothetical protein
MLSVWISSVSWGCGIITKIVFYFHKRGKEIEE